MQRNLFPMNKCNSSEQKLLKALRALNWEGSWPTQASFLFEELGIISEHAFPFAMLIKAILQSEPNFALLGPDSPFVSNDEMTLLAALGHMSRQTSLIAIDLSPLTPIDLPNLFNICGQELRLAKVMIKYRAVLKTAQDLITKYTMSDPTIPPYLTTRVAHIEQLTPKVKRIILTGQALSELHIQQPAQWVKVFLPNTTSDMTGRAYTIRHFNSDTQELTLDIALHHNGLISSWAETAAIGDEVYIAGPLGGFNVPDIDSWLLLLADNTGIAAVASILESLPLGVEAYVFIEVDNKAEQQHLETKANAKFHWIFKQEQRETLLDILKKDLLPKIPGHAWVAAEAATIRALRTQLIKEYKFDLANLQTAGYWKIGEEDHKDLAAGR